MSVRAAEVSVGGTTIASEAIAAEAQNHPAEDPEQAWLAAAEALVIKTLLLEEAERLGVGAVSLNDDRGRELAPEDSRIEALLEQEVSVPSADEPTCRRFYKTHMDRFTGPDIVEASHILFAADREDVPAYAEAVRKAEAAIAELKERPEAFADLARTRSACPSAKQGGNLGQLGPGQTVEEFETFLFNLEEGQLCTVPVKTRFGAHVLKLGRKEQGKTLPFGAVHEKIAAYLEEASWRRAVAQYVGILAGRTQICGVSLNGTPDPLVQ